MTHKYEIWLENSGYRTVSVFVDDKEYTYTIPDSNFEIYMNCGIVVRFIGNHAGVLFAGYENPKVFWDGEMEYVKFDSDFKLDWVVIIPMKSQDNITAIMEDD